MTAPWTTYQGNELKYKNQLYKLSGNDLEGIQPKKKKPKKHTPLQ